MLSVYKPHSNKHYSTTDELHKTADNDYAYTTVVVEQ